AHVAEGEQSQGAAVADQAIPTGEPPQGSDREAGEQQPDGPVAGAVGDRFDGIRAEPAPDRVHHDEADRNEGGEDERPLSEPAGPLPDHRSPPTLRSSPSGPSPSRDSPPGRRSR